MCLDSSAVRDFVEHGADVRVLDRSGRAPLSLALTSYTVYWHPPNVVLEDIVGYLLDHGADPNLRFSYGQDAHYTPLGFAAYDGNLRLVRMLVEHGADVNLRDDRGHTAAHLAAVWDFRLSCDDCTGNSAAPPKPGALPTLRYLVEHGADLTVKSKASERVIDMVPTPCPRDPDACQLQNVGDARWVSGSCPKTYRYIATQLAAHGH